jgi:hypothetical protein
MFCLYLYSLLPGSSWIVVCFPQCKQV